MVNRKSDTWELFWSVAPMLVFAILVAIVIMAAPSVDSIVFGK
jgi:hypothetical protein